MNATIRIVLLAVFTAAIAMTPAPASAESNEATFDSAVFLLRQSMKLSRDGRHSVMLRSLRQMADPQMVPLFNELASSAYPVFKIHGLLGLAECSDRKQIDLVRLASVEDPAIQAELVSAALDNKLLSLDQCQQLVDWPGLDLAVKVIVSAPLIEAGRLSKTQPLEDAAKADNLGRRHLANLMLLQLGHNSAADTLDQLSASTAPERDQVRAMLLSTAVRYQMDRIGPWAMKVAAEPDIRAQLSLLALSVAMRFNTPGSVNIWQQQFASTTDAAQRMRLALMALRVSPWSAPSLYQPLLQEKDPLLAAVGKAGAAVASGKDVTAAVVGLVELHHPIANAWALSYASEDASEQNAKLILLSVILAFEQGPLRGREQRLDDAISAVQRLVERSPEDAVTLLKPMLADARTHRELAMGILLGLLRSKAERSHEVIQGLPAFEDINTRNMALVLLATHNQQLTADQLDDLGLCVRGGGLRMDALRIQAAWSWLKRTGQVGKAIDLALKP